MAPLLRERSFVLVKVVLVVFLQILGLFQLVFTQATTETTPYTITPSTGTDGSVTDDLSTAERAVTTDATVASAGAMGAGPNLQQLQAGTTAASDVGEGETVVEPNRDVGTCVCDLTSNACDVNCCCDSECSPQDRSSFTECADTARVIDRQLCFQSTVIFKENVPEVVNTSNPELFCIVIDNNEGRNYYTVPKLVDSEQQFTELANQYGSSSFAPPDDGTPTYGGFYKAGNSIFTIYESLALGTLGLPTSSYSSLCDDNNPASFLIDQSASCVRQLSDLAAQCENTPFLSARTYYDGFKLVPTPRYLATDLPALNGTEDYSDFYANGTLITIEIVEPVLCQDSTGQRSECGFSPSMVPNPSFDTQCNNVLLELAYTVTHNSSGGIETITAQLVLGNLVPVTGNLPFGQTFSVAFIKADEVDTFRRSGNPGYVVGMPVLAGDLVTQVIDGQTRYAIELSSNRSNWLTVIKSTAGGTCETSPDSRTPVNFGEDLRTGCRIQVTLANTADRCSVIQTTALDALNGVMRDRVATFGNSKVENAGDWVPIIVEEITGTPSSPVEGTCNNMIMGLHIEVIYGNVGSLANPQAKILGVRYNYAEGRTLRYTCSGANCQTGASTLLQSFEIVSSVAFIDASTPTSPILAEDPGIEAKLPNDFFYPFSIGGGSNLQLDVRLLCLAVLSYLVFQSQKWI